MFRRVFFSSAILVIFFSILNCSKNKDIVREGTVVVAIDQTPVNLDPRIGVDKASENFHRLMFNGLMTKNDQSRMIPDLAESYEKVTPLLYRFRLKSGVRFHDGRPLTAADVVFTYRSILSGEISTAKRAALESIHEVRTTEFGVLEVELKEPFNGLLSNMNIGIVPEGSGSDFSSHPIGTGPYKLLSYAADSGAEFEAYEDYFEGRPQNNRLSLRIIPDATTRALEIRKGTVDLMFGPNIVPPDYFRILKSNPRLTTLTRTGSNYAYIGFNLQDPILKNKTVRQAIGYAINRQDMVNNLFYGSAEMASGLLPPHNWAYESEVLRLSYDPYRAMSMLDSAGYPDPDGEGPAKRFSLTFKVSTSEFRKLIATVVQKDLERIGIDLKIRSYEFGTFFSDVNRGNFQLCMLLWIGETDPDIYRIAFSTNGPRNRGKYSDSQLDEWVDNARTAPSEQEQLHYYSMVQKKVAEDCPYISLWYERNLCVMRKQVQGMRLTPDSDYRVLKDVYISAAQS